MKKRPKMKKGLSPSIETENKISKPISIGIGNKIGNTGITGGGKF